MKKILILFIVAFFYSCSNTSSEFVNVSLPNFKPQVPTNTDNIEKTNIKVKLSNINLIQNNNNSLDFEQSVLKIRINKEIELLKENLKEQISTILALKGYNISDQDYDYELNTTIVINLEETNIIQSNQFFNGQSIESDLILSFKANIDFINIKDINNTTNITTDANLDSNIKIIYPVKSEDGVTMFKTSLSSVPTQLNKGLERPAFDIDRAFLSFYKNTLNTLYNNLPMAQEEKTEKEFNEFNPNLQDTNTSSEEEVIILE